MRLSESGNAHRAPRCARVGGGRWWLPDPLDRRVTTDRPSGQVPRRLSRMTGSSSRECESRSCLPRVERMPCRPGEWPGHAQVAHMARRAGPARVLRDRHMSARHAICAEGGMTRPLAGPEGSHALQSPLLGSSSRRPRLARCHHAVGAHHVGSVALAGAPRIAVGRRLSAAGRDRGVHRRLRRSFGPARRGGGAVERPRAARSGPSVTTAVE